MPQDALTFALHVVDAAVLAEEDRGLPPGTMVAALFSAAAATLAHHFGWERSTLVQAASELTGSRTPVPLADGADGEPVALIA